MKTNAKITKDAFETMHYAYFAHRTHSEKIDELILIFENNDGNYYNNFMSSKRTKAHSGAFYSIVLALKAFMPKGYYASNDQIKKCVAEFWGMDYKAFLAPMVEYLEEQRNANLA